MEKKKGDGYADRSPVDQVGFADPKKSENNDTFRLCKTQGHL